MRDISSPIQSPMIRPLAKGEIGVQVRSPLNERDVEVFDEFLSSNPMAWLRVYNSQGQGPVDWSWLGQLRNIRKLWIDLIYDAHFKHEWIDLLPSSLLAIYLPSSLDMRSHLKKLLRFPYLEDLSISGRLRDLSSVSEIGSLRSLKLFRVCDASLGCFRGNSGINKISIESSRGIDLDGMDGMEGLEAFSSFDSKLLSVERICTSRKLKRISLIHVKGDAGIASLEMLEELRLLRISKMKPGYRLVDIFSAPKLEQLCLDDFLKDCVDRGFCRGGAPGSLRKVYLGLLGDAVRESLGQELGVHVSKDSSGFSFGVEASVGDW